MMKLVITAQTIGKSTLNTVNTVLGKEHIEINQDGSIGRTRISASVKVKRLTYITLTTT